MKRKKIILLALILVGLVIAIFLGKNNNNSTLKKQRNDFAIEDTLNITKIFLSDKSNNNLLLERIDTSNWIADGEYQVRRDVIKTLLKTIKTLTVRAPVSKARFDYTIKQLASNSTKIEIYKNNATTPSKTYYVGASNKENTGTFMLLENSSVPFLMHIEGHYGFLQSRYSTRLNDWRDNTIWYFPSKEIMDITSLKVEYPEAPKKSFEIIKDVDEKYTLLDYNKNKVSLPNLSGVYEFLKRFKRISYEGFEETKPKSYCDSLIKNSPIQTIWTIKEKSGKTTEVKSYLKPAKKEATDLEGNPILYDLERMYALVNNKDFVIIQYYVFDPLTITSNDFFPPSQNVEK